MPIDTVLDDDGILLITINRPERMNALDHDAYDALSAAWIRVRDDDAVRAAVITGAGDRAFCAGADITSYLTEPDDLSTIPHTQSGQLLNSGLEVWKPVVAAVNGHCLGGGMTLLLATDVRVAAEHATFAVTEVKRGLVPGNGGTQRMLHQLPYPVAMQMLLSGDALDAAAALRHGLVNDVVAQADLLDVAFGHARRILANAPLAVQAAKELAVRSQHVDLGTGLRLERTMNRLLQFSADAAEGPAAFAERRAPRFQGR